MSQSLESVSAPEPVFTPRTESGYKIPYCFSWAKVYPPILLSKIRNQNECVCGWCVVAAGCIEAIYNITHISTPEKMIEVSCQSFLENVLEKPDDIYDSCGGFIASVERAFDFAMKYGFAEEVTCPFKAGRFGEFSVFHPFSRIREYVLLGDYESVIERLKIQPVAAVIVASDNFLTLEKEIYTGPAPHEMDCLKEKLKLHAVLVIGYGADVTGKRFFIVRNSMGKKWGVSGVGKIGMNSVRLEDEDYFLLDRFCYPVL